MKAAGFSVTFSTCFHRFNVIVREKSHHETFISRHHAGILGSEILIILILYDISLLLTLHPAILEYSSGISSEELFSVILFSCTAQNFNWIFLFIYIWSSNMWKFVQRRPKKCGAVNAKQFCYCNFSKEMLTPFLSITTQNCEKCVKLCLIVLPFLFDFWFIFTFLKI